MLHSNLTQGTLLTNLLFMFYHLMKSLFLNIVFKYSHKMILTRTISCLCWTNLSYLKHKFSNKINVCSVLTMLTIYIQNNVQFLLHNQKRQSIINCIGLNFFYSWKLNAHSNCPHEGKSNSRVVWWKIDKKYLRFKWLTYWFDHSETHSTK